MIELLASLEQTIEQLEIVRDSSDNVNVDLIRQISDLYDQQQRLLESVCCVAFGKEVCSNTSTSAHQT